MSHLAGRCACGRRIHFSAGSGRGARWQCHACGQSWVIASHGSNRLHTTGSRRPRQGGAGCLVVLAAGIAAGWLALVLLS